MLLFVASFVKNRKRMVKNFVVPIQKLLQPEGTLASSSLFKLMGPKSASLVLSCCLSAVSTCSFATRLAALAFVASRSPVKTVKSVWHAQRHAEGLAHQQGSSGLYVTNWDAP